MMKLLADERGGVFAEAVIALPVILLVWTLVYFVHDGYEEALRAGESNRRGAYMHAQSACTQAPSGGSRYSESTENFDLLRAPGYVVPSTGTLTQYQPELVSSSAAGGESYRDTVQYDIKSFRYRINGSIRRPTVLGGRARFGHQTALACDEKHVNPNFSSWINAAFRRMH